MDRRGHGESQPGENYTLRKESEDVAAVVNSRRGPVFVLGHSIGGVFALEAALLTNKIAKLALYNRLCRTWTTQQLPIAWNV